ncbi:MAG: FHA domain-containing protein [Anaerolineales bacterium]
MTQDRLTLTIDIKPRNLGAKEINVRSSLLVANFISEIQDKFNLDGTLELHPKGKPEPLLLGEPIQQAGVEDGIVLICERVVEDTGTQDAILRGVREPFDAQFKRVYLAESRTMTEYELAWQPAIVGRKDRRDPSKNRLLAVDLEHIEDLPTVSRHHACITSKGGTFFIEQIQARNPTFLDEARLKLGIKYPLAAGSQLRVGRVSLTFYLTS